MEIANLSTVLADSKLFRCRGDRMQCLVMKRMMLGDALNWLSTLGGAYSALGDYYQHHVRRMLILEVSKTWHFSVAQL